MTTEALTGRDAAEAIGLAAQLGNRNARFDGPAVLRALRTRVGRLRVGASLMLAVRAPFHVETPRRAATGRRPRRAQRAARAAAAAGRPSGTPRRENGLGGVPDDV